MDFQTKAKSAVANYFNLNRDKSDSHAITIDDVYIVWFSKTLQNFKAMLSTTVSDGMYYEYTYDGDKERAYLDAYKKWENVTLYDFEG